MSNFYSPPNKKTKPFSPIWINFDRHNSTDPKRKATCLHCNEQVRNRSTEAGRHLDICKALKSSGQVPARSGNQQIKRKEAVSSFIGSFLDRIDETENDKLQLMFAECIYAAGISFHSVTSKRWHKFFARIRPNFKPPTEKQLTTGLLEKSYQKNVKTSEVYLEQTNHLSLVIHTWKNVRKDSVISIVAMTPAPILVKSIDTKGEKDADDIFPVLDEIIKKLDPKKITGLIVTDEQKMLSLKEKVTKEHKHIVFSGCSVHKLNDLMKKICELVPIENIVSGTKEIVNEINGNQKLHEKYREMVGTEFLSLFSGSRFAGSVMMMNSVIDSMTVLKSLAEDSNNEISTINRKRILSLEEQIYFNQNLLSLQSILKPISDTIHEMETNCHSMADMIEQIKKLEKVPLDAIKSFGEDVVSKVTTLFNDIISSIKTPPALLSNILHPFYRGKSLSIEEKSTASTFVGIFSKSLYMNENVTMESYQQFINQEGHFSQSSVSSMDPKRVTSWWKFVSNLSDHNPLCEIAMRLLNVQPTTTAVERTFSKRKYFHSKNVNILPGGKMNKLVYINSNINTFDSDLDFNESNHESEHDNDDEGSGIDLSELCCSVLEYMDHSSNE